MPAMTGPEFWVVFTIGAMAGGTLGAVVVGLVMRSTAPEPPAMLVEAVRQAEAESPGLPALCGRLSPDGTSRCEFVYGHQGGCGVWVADE